ncbi:MAG: hypothetical protein LBD09_02995, partial [Treponema sp.]|nr:hypothetical protein [Treponema sp.]
MNRRRPFCHCLFRHARFFLRGLGAAALIAGLAACDPDTVERLTGEQEQKRQITALPPAAAEETAEEDPAFSHLVLERGNRWSAGIPGFGGNALSAFTGEYRIPGKLAPVRVWLTKEFLYYEGWTPREGVPGTTVLRRDEGTGALAAIQSGGLWTVVVLFPGELSPEEEDRLIGIFSDRLTGFSSQAQNISLPALIPY